MGKTILITGANRGIGLELTREFASYGWRVLACCRDPQGAAELQTLAERSAGAVTVSVYPRPRRVMRPWVRAFRSSCSSFGRSFSRPATCPEISIGIGGDGESVGRAERLGRRSAKAVRIAARLT